MLEYDHYMEYDPIKIIYDDRIAYYEQLEFKLRRYYREKLKANNLRDNVVCHLSEDIIAASCAFDFIKVIELQTKLDTYNSLREQYDKLLTKILAEKQAIISERNFQLKHVYKQYCNHNLEMQLRNQRLSFVMGRIEPYS